MSQFVPAGMAIESSLQQLNEKFRKRIVVNSIRLRWKEILGNLAEDILFVTAVGDKLVLYAQNSAAKDNFKFISKDVLDRANQFFGAELLKKIEFAKNFKKAQTSSNILSETIRREEFHFEDVELEDSEIAQCEEFVAEIKNPKIKKIALESLIQKKKSDKQKIQQGWRKCKICGVLCAPKQILCASCKITERNKMRSEIRKIFLTKPQIKHSEVLDKIKKKFAPIAQEISLQTVASEKNFLIRNLAAKIKFGDYFSNDAKQLVMLYRGLSKAELTDAIIKRALNELKFNLAEVFNAKADNK